VRSSRTGGGGGQGAGLAVDEHIVTEDHERGDRGDAQGPGEVLLGLGVHLGEGDVGVGLGGLLVDGAEAHARTAPGGPEVNEGDALAVDGVLELGAGDVLGGHEHSFQDCGY